MSDPRPHIDPCARCLKPHPARIAADGGRTYRHEDGHAWKPPESAKPAVRLVPPSNILTAEHAGFDIILGEFAFCRDCGVSTSNTSEGMRKHRERDKAFDELLNLVQRLTNEVMRLTAIVNNRGGAA